MIDTSRWERGGWLWVVLMAVLAMPIPMQGVLVPQRGVPILYLMVAGAAVLCWRLVAPVSWPAAGLLAFSVAHVVVGGLPMRGLQLVVLLGMAALLFVEAASISRVWARRAGWALLVGAAVQGALGALNVAHVYPSPTAPAALLPLLGLDPVPVYRFFDSGPWMTLLTREWLGRPMGWLTHPNYWGSYMALSVPVVWALLGPRWAVWVLFSVASSVSVGPIVSAAAGALVMAWRDFGARARTVMAGVLAAAVLVVAAAHLAPIIRTWERVSLETLTSGRTSVWATALPHILERPVLGNGVGTWRVWATEYNRATKSDYATEQAHNEPVQLAFELGLVGLALAAALLWQLQRGAAAIYHLGAPDELMWLGVLAVALVNSLGSPTFHLPWHAGVAIFAAARVLAFTRGE